MHILLAVCVGTLLVFFLDKELVNSKCFPCNGWVVSETAQSTEHFVGFLSSHFARQIRWKSRAIECCVWWFMEVSDHCFPFFQYDKAKIVQNPSVCNELWSMTSCIWRMYVISFNISHNVSSSYPPSVAASFWCIRKSQQLLQKPKECKIVTCWDEIKLCKVASCRTRKSLLRRCRLFFPGIMEGNN